MRGWKEKLFFQYLQHWKANPRRLRRYLKGRPPFVVAKPQLKPGVVRVAALQLKLNLYGDPLHYLEEMCQQVEKAASLGASLVAFPENNGLQLLGMLPGLEKISAREPNEALFSQTPVLEVLRLIGPPIEKIARFTFSFLAAHYKIYVMAGSFWRLEGERVFNCAYLFDPQGNLLGTQDKVHLFPLEKEWGLSSGEAFKVFHTALGVLAMPVCMDATYFETFRILRHLGAEIAIVPIANAEPYNYFLALRGIWPRVQESLVYGLKSALVGSFFGLPFSGRAGIFAPLELTPGKNGVLAETGHHDGTDLVTADLDLNALHELRAGHPYLGDVNLQLSRRYFPAAYHFHANRKNGHLP